MRVSESTIYKILRIANTIVMLERMGKVVLPKDKSRTKALAHEVWREVDNTED